MAVRETEVRCHELLLRLADRLPDRYLWRYRDWLAGSAAEVLARVLPATLVREHVALPDAEQRHVAEALLPLGADPGLVNAILPSRTGTDGAGTDGTGMDGTADPGARGTQQATPETARGDAASVDDGAYSRTGARFIAQPHNSGSTAASGDAAVLVLGATLRGRTGVQEVRSSWRQDPTGLKRVVLVLATDEYIALTGEVQRVLRALGEAEPRVEVLPTGVQPSAYHRAALAESEFVCAGPERNQHNHRELGATPRANAR